MKNWNIIFLYCLTKWLLLTSIFSQAYIDLKWLFWWGHFIVLINIEISIALFAQVVVIYGSTINIPCTPFSFVLSSTSEKKQKWNLHQLRTWSTTFCQIFFQDQLTRKSLSTWSKWSFCSVTESFLAWNYYASAVCGAEL